MTVSLWPDAGQLLLLRAALGEGEDAVAAFAQWRASVDYERHLDGGSYRLLPLARANLTRLGVSDPVLAKLGGVHRRSWIEAQGQIRRGTEAVARLGEAGIPVLACKGLALAFTCYDSPGHRPMSDVDLLVPRGDAPRAIATLEAAGWQLYDDQRAHWAQRPRDLLALSNGIALHDGAGREVDLHWRMISECADPAIEARYWSEARPFAVEGTRLLRPATTTLLLHIIVHGLKPNELPPIRWIADAALLLRRLEHEVDWQALVRDAKTARVEHRLGRGLEYLRDTMGIAIPAEAVSLVEQPPRLVERMEQRAEEAALARASYDRQARLGLLANAVRRAGNADRGQIPGLVLRWAVRRLRRAAA